MALTRSASKIPLRERSPPVSPSQSISPARKKLSIAPAAEESACPTTEKMFATILERLESLTTSQHNIVSRLTDIERKQDETTRLVQSAVETAEKASDTASQLKAEVSVLEKEIKRVQRDTKSTMARLQTDILKETADRISREANVILIGLDETATDTDQTAIKTTVVQFAKKEMALEMKEEDIVETRRLGKQGGDDGKPRHRPRPLLVKFRTAHAKKEFTSARGRLKGKDIFINDDLTPTEQARRRALVPLYKSIKSSDKNARCHLVRDQLVLNGRELTATELEELTATLTSGRSNNTTPQ